MANFKTCIRSIWRWASNYIRFSKAAPFIIGLIFSKAFVEIAFKAFLVSYIDETWEELSIREAIALSAAFDGILYFLTIAINLIAIDHLGDFPTLLLTLPCLIFGLLMLWLSSFRGSLGTSNLTLYIALLLIIVGLAGEEASLRPILYQQFEDDKIFVDDRGSEKQRRREYDDIVWGRVNLWSYGAGFLSKLTYWVLLSSNLGWEQRTKVSFIAVAVGYAVFICGRCCYELERPTRQPVVARFKEATRLVKLIPLWLLFIPYSFVQVAGFTLFILQSDRLKTGINPRLSQDSSNEIPLTSLYVLGTFTSSLVSLSSKFVIGNVWRNEERKQHRARFARMGVGLLFASGSSLSSWLVETRRLTLIKKLKYPPQIPMTILWLAPQFAFLGIANGLIEKGLTDFFYDRVPVSMWNPFEVPLNTGVMCIGYCLSAVATWLARDWIADENDDCRFDKYLQMLTFLNIAVVPVYIFFSFMSDWSMPDKVDGREIEIEDVDGGEIEIEDAEDVGLRF